MLDIKLIRENPDLVKENIKKKFQDQKLPLVDEVLELDKENRAVMAEAQELRSARNSLSKQVGILMGQAKKDPSKLAEAEQLKAEGISARVINIHTIKPIDEEIIIKAAKETGLIVTAEEHSVIGGLGSAVCDVVSANCPVKVVKIGVNDVFGYSGPAVQLLKEFGLCSENVVKTVKQALSSK